MNDSVFVCYARTDERFVLWLATELRLQGIQIWLDQWSITEGSDWDQAIDAALMQCSCLLMVLSPDSLASGEARGELRSALDLGKPIIPVMLRRCALPRRLRNIQYVDVSRRPENDAQSVARIAKAIEASKHQSSRTTSSTVATRISIPQRAPDRHSPVPAASIIGRLRRYGEQHVSSLLALGFPPILAGTWHYARLPTATSATVSVFGLTVLLCAVMLWLRNRSGAALVSSLIGTAFVLKPWIVPMEGFVDGEPFPYTSQTALDYSLPGAGFLFAALVLCLVSAPHRLLHDLRDLRPTVQAGGLALVSALAAANHYSAPTLYDVYLPFRPGYAARRVQLRKLATALDPDANAFPLAQPLTVPLVLDRRRRVRGEDASTTGHILLYQHLTKTDEFFGDIEHGLMDDLHLHLRDTGPDPVLYRGGFATVAAKDRDVSLRHTLRAPYLVVVMSRALKFRRGRIDDKDVEAANPFRVFLYQLEHDALLCALDLESPVKTRAELIDAIENTLQRGVGARLIKDDE